MKRRELLLAGAAAITAPALLRANAGLAMPSLFFAHGAPFLATDEVRGRQLFRLAAGLPRKPRAIVGITPHVRAEYVSVAASGVARRSFPRQFHARIGDITYTAPAADAVAARVGALLGNTGVPIADRPHPGFNHTLWMGLLHMFPAADIPVVEVAMPFLPPARLFKLGQALAALREDDVLIIASGSLTHNLATLFVDHTPTWASDFDAWIGACLAARDIDQILDWRHKAPAADIAHPDDGGHFNVMLYALGAVVGERGDFSQASAANLGYEFGSFSTRDYLFS